MEFFFFLDIYGDRELIDCYIISFKLNNLQCVEITNWSGKAYISAIKDWEKFKKNVTDIRLYEYGDEIERFSDIETALKEGYRIAYREASRRGAKDIIPAVGFGTPPMDVIKRVFPVDFNFDPFPKNLDDFLEDIVKKTDNPVERSSNDDG